MFSITEHAGGSVNSNGLDDEFETADGRATRWAPHRKARRKALLREIRTIVHETGPDISMEGIAAGLGTSKSILYRYFGDKHGLQAALGNYTLQATRRHLTTAARAEASAELALGAMVRTYLEAVARSRNVFLFVNQPSGRGPLQSFVGDVEELVASVICMGAARAREPVALQYAREFEPLVAGPPDTDGVRSLGLEAELATRAMPGGHDVVVQIDEQRLRLWAAGAVGLVRAAAERWAETPTHERIPIDQLSGDLTTMMWRGALDLLRT